jgi:hypothetical protein
MAIAATVAACLEPYEPKVNANVHDILSVNGFINASNGSATVDIRHVQPMGSDEGVQPESGSNVRIETSSGKLFALSESAAGHYVATGLDVDFNLNYTLFILTAGGRELRSSPIKLQHTSAIKTITTAATSNGEALSINVTSDSNSDRSQYYAWDYIETYEYTVKYFSSFKKVNKVPVYRTDTDLIYRCWRTVNSTKIIVGNTLALEDNTIHNFPVALIPKGTPQLSIRYSILVRQRCVDLTEYKFLTNLRKTTENLGGLFDPIPFAVIGNMVETTDDRMPVLGYFSGSELSEKRLFVSWAELPSVLQLKPAFPPCEEESTCDTRIPPNRGVFTPCLNVLDLSDNNIITVVSTDQTGNAFSYNYAPRECADCRFFGGVTTRPDFW